MARPYIYFATPTLRGELCVQYVQSMLGTFSELDKLHLSGEISMQAGDCFVDKSRNTLCKRFLERPAATDLFFVDDDLGWPAAAAIKLIESDYPVACGVYPMKWEQGGYPVHLEPGVAQDGWLRAAEVPGGFLRIKRAVLEAIQQEWPEDTYQNPEVGAIPGDIIYNFFQSGVQRGTFLGEDTAFSRKLALLDIPIWVWPDIDFEHVNRRYAHRGNLMRALEGARNAPPN